MLPYWSGWFCTKYSYKSADVFCSLVPFNPVSFAPFFGIVPKGRHSNGRTINVIGFCTLLPKTLLQLLYMMECSAFLSITTLKSVLFK